MDEPSLTILAVTIGAVLVVLVGGLVLVSHALVKAEQGHALVVSKPGRDEVRFGSSVVLPLVHRAERIDLRTKTLSIDRRGKQGISCRDGVRADVTLTAHLRINPTTDDVLKVAHTVGCARASRPPRLRAPPARARRPRVTQVAARKAARCPRRHGTIASSAMRSSATSARGQLEHLGQLGDRELLPVVELEQRLLVDRQAPQRVEQEA